jgi:thioredoxin-like negative regulator of GroEL
MFSTSKCTYCRPVKAIVEGLAYKYNQLDVGFLVVDEDPEAMQMAEHWGISHVPTIIMIKDAQVLNIFAGANECTEHNLEEYVKRSLQSDVFQESPGGIDGGSCSILRDSGEQENAET